MPWHAKRAEAVDRARIIGLLIEIRGLVRSSIEVEHCPHAGFYDGEDRRCQACAGAPECRWLNDNDELVALERKSMSELADALGFAIDRVDIEVRRWGHAPRRCPCRICTWLRDARARERAARQAV